MSEKEATMRATRRITFGVMWLSVLSLAGLVGTGLFRCATAPRPTASEKCLEWVQEQYEKCTQNARGTISDDQEYRLLQLCEERLPAHRQECAIVLGGATE